MKEDWLATCTWLRVLKYDWTKGRPGKKIGRWVRQGCCFSVILFNLYSECLAKEGLDAFGDFKIEGQIIHTVKYEEVLVLMAKEEKVLLNMIDKLIEIQKML